MDDNAICIYEMKSGIIGTMTASWTYYAAEDNSTVIYGTEGEMRIYDDPAHSIVLRKKGGEPEYFDVEQIPHELYDRHAAAAGRFFGAACI